MLYCECTSCNNSLHSVQELGALRYELPHQRLVWKKLHLELVYILIILLPIEVFMVVVGNHNSFSGSSILICIQHFESMRACIKREHKLH